jgi:hypothetical protein
VRPKGWSESARNTAAYLALFDTCLILRQQQQ